MKIPLWLLFCNMWEILKCGICVANLISKICFVVLKKKRTQCPYSPHFLSITHLFIIIKRGGMLAFRPTSWNPGKQADITLACPASWCYCSWPCQRSSQWHLNSGISAHQEAGHWWVNLRYGFGFRMSLVTAVPLHVCCCHFFLLLVHEWAHGDPYCLECSVIISWIYTVLLGIFICGLLCRWFHFKLYCLTEIIICYYIICNNGVILNIILIITGL